MHRDDIWPLLSLSIESPRLTLRPVRDVDIPGMAEAALEGIRPPERHSLPDARWRNFGRRRRPL